MKHVPKLKNFHKTAENAIYFALEAFSVLS